jgi:hypothetical protein
MFNKIKRWIFKNRIKAIKNCRSHWYFLFNHPQYEKYDYLPATQWRHNCAACEYTSYKLFGMTFVKCRYCPIPWPGGHCSHEDSPFKTWINSSCFEVRSEAARKIIDLCDQALIKLRE